MKKSISKISYITKNDLKLLRRAFKYLRPHLFLFIVTFISNNMGMLLNIVQPLVYGNAIDYIIQGETKLFWKTILIIFGITILNGGFSILKRYLNNLLGMKVVLGIKKDLYNHLIDLPVKFYDDTRVGEIISRLEGDVNVLNSVITTQAMQIVIDIITVFAIGYIIFRINVIMSLIVLCTFPLTYFIMGYFGNALRKRGKVMRECDDSYYSFLAESFSGIREVKALNIENSLKNKFISWNQQIFGLQISMGLISSLSGFLINALNSINNLAVMGVGGYLIIHGLLTMGKYISFNTYSSQFNGALTRVASLNSTIQKALVSLERIFKLIDNFMLEPERRDGLIPEQVKGEFRVDNISFSYDSETMVLNDISFTVPSNQMIAFVGASGSGKTTLFNLLLRFYRPSKGEIFFDDYPLNDINIEYLYDQISLVSQEPFLFNLSIKENLLLARPDASMEEIISVAKKAYIHDFIMSLPEGYETIIGERGTKLSGGQKQRLAIARAILKKSKVLLFDEATSALDGQAEEHIQNMLNNLMKDHTILVIAHRLSTVINADKIVVIENGQIVAVGTHQDLIETSETYQCLYQSQWYSICNAS